MPYQDSLVSRAEPFVSAATLAAHATFLAGGFRQRDVRFYADLFSNWTEFSFPESTLEIKNAQIARYLQDLIDEGFARRVGVRSPPRYRLTRGGLLYALTRVANRSYLHAPDHFFFLYFFLKGYGERIELLVRQEGKEYPPAIRVEVEAMLDTTALLNRERHGVRQALRRVEEREGHARSSSELARVGLAGGRTLEDVVDELQRKHPYDLNSVKPLSELIRQIPNDQRGWELVSGNVRRADLIFGPTRRRLEEYLRELDRFATSEGR
jgi:hypothetical protein